MSESCFNTTIFRDNRFGGRAYGVEVYYMYSPGIAGRRYMSNGDPGYPDEPAEVEIDRVIFYDIDILDLLTDDEIDIITINIIDDIEYEQECDEYDYDEEEQEYYDEP